jgi:hypothetical protein
MSSPLFVSSKNPNSSVSHLLEQIHQKDDAIIKLRSQLHAVQNSKAQEVLNEAASQTSLHVTTNVSRAQSLPGTVSLFGLRDLKVMPNCSQSDGIFFPPIVSASEMLLCLMD